IFRDLIFLTSMGRMVRPCVRIAHLKERVMKRWILLAALGLCPAMAITSSALAADMKDEKGDNEVKVKLEDCPKPVQDTLKKQVGSGTIKDIDKETEDGKTVYEADATIDGKN